MAILWEKLSKRAPAFFRCSRNFCAAINLIGDCCELVPPKCKPFLIWQIADLLSHVEGDVDLRFFGTGPKVWG